MFCGSGVVVVVVLLWLWCCCGSGGVVVVMLWCGSGGVVVVSELNDEPIVKIFLIQIHLISRYLC